MEQISQGGTGREQDHDDHQHRRPPAQLMVKNVKNEDVEALATQVPTTVTFTAMHEFTLTIAKGNTADGENSGDEAQTWRRTKEYAEGLIRQINLRNILVWSVSLQQYSPYQWQHLCG